MSRYSPHLRRFTFATRIGSSLRCAGAAVALLSLAAIGVASDEKPTDPPVRGAYLVTAQAALERFLSNSSPGVTTYVARRRLNARNERFNVEGWLEACTWLSEAEGFNYRVLAEGGSGLIRGRVLKKALQTEREAWADGETGRSGIEPRNYRFEIIGPVEGDLVKVGLTPLRKHRMLIAGAVFLTPEDGDLVRLEGRPATNPSFWTQRVEITRHYARVAGARVPVALESVAHVRFAGQSTFRMTYEYARINGLDVNDSIVCEPGSPQRAEVVSRQ